MGDRRSRGPRGRAGVSDSDGGSPVPAATLSSRRPRGPGGGDHVPTRSGGFPALDKGREWDRALGLLEDMPRYGVAPDVVTFSTAISACARGGLWERALALLDDMARGGVVPSPVTCTNALRACAASDRWEAALALLGEMRSKYGMAPNNAAYSATISACVRAGEDARAVEVYRAALAEGVYLGSGIDHDAQPASSSKDGGARYVDLHGMSVDVARIAVAELLNGLRRAHRDGGGAAPPGGASSSLNWAGGLLIITGRGENSRGRTPVLKPEILEMLLLPEYTALEASEQQDNPGALFIKAASLRAWVVETQLAG